MTKRFTHNGTDYFVSVHDCESERTLHVCGVTDKRSRISITISHDDILDGKDFGLDALADMLEADFRRLVDDKILTP